MTITKTATTAYAVNVDTIVFNGKAGPERAKAFRSIATLAFLADKSRTVMIKALDVALGAKPSAVHVATAKNEYVIGIAASKLAPRKGAQNDTTHLEHVRSLVTDYVAPKNPDVKTPKALPAGKLGYRSMSEHMVIRNAEKNWSLIAGELGYSKAQTLKDKRAKQTEAEVAKAEAVAIEKVKRGASVDSGMGKASTEPKASTIGAQAVQAAPRLRNRREVHEYMVLQMATLSAFCDKNAKLVTLDAVTAIRACKVALDSVSKQIETYEAIERDAAK